MKIATLCSSFHTMYKHSMDTLTKPSTCIINPSHKTRSFRSVYMYTNLFNHFPEGFNVAPLTHYTHATNGHRVDLTMRVAAPTCMTMTKICYNNTCIRILVQCTIKLTIVTHIYYLRAVKAWVLNRNLFSNIVVMHCDIFKL